MADDEIFVTADKMLAGMDFAVLSKEQEERHRGEMAAALSAFLPIADSLEALEERCGELVEQEKAEVPLRSVSVLVKQVLQVFSGLGVEPMETCGQPVDLDLHEVVAVRSEPGMEEDTILEETQRGYFWKEKRLRQARVVVSQPAPEGAAQAKTRAQGGKS